MDDSSGAHRCIFCLRTDGGFQKKAHVIPESACNEELVLPKGCECDRCNAVFSSIEQPIIRSLPGQIFRVGFVKKTKRGIKPTADIKGGRITSVDSSAGATLQILRHSRNPYVVEDKIEPEKSTFVWESSQSLLGRKFSAFLAKIALGYFCLQEVDVYSTDYDHLRKCAKSFDPSYFIPFFIGVHVDPSQDIRLLGEGEEIVHKAKPVWIRFPGFSGILPTAQHFPQASMLGLESFVTQNVPGHSLITDPDWSKPVRFTMILEPAIEVIRSQHRELWRFLSEGRNRDSSISRT